jgi:hypothetical protein
MRGKRGREEEEEHDHRCRVPLVAGAVAPVRVGMESERLMGGRERREQMNLEGEAGAVVYIWFSAF